MTGYDNTSTTADEGSSGRSDGPNSTSIATSLPFGKWTLAGILVLFGLVKLTVVSAGLFHAGYDIIVPLVAGTFIIATALIMHNAR
ncbi:MAG: hypothetical protein ABEJ28_03430 [Salinigranum sp.]